MRSIPIGMSLLFLILHVGCTSADVGDRKLREEEAAKARQAVPRRAVPMMTERPFPPAAPAPAPRIVPPTVVAPVPQAPVPTTSCDPGGCWSGGSRYNGGTGGIYLDRSGRMCQSNGNWIQCF